MRSLLTSTRFLLASPCPFLCNVQTNFLWQRRCYRSLIYLVANELEDILSCDDEVLNDVYEWWVPPVRRLPPLLWVRIQTDLGPYLVERGLKGGTPVLSWYHRQFREAAEEVMHLIHKKVILVHVKAGFH